MRKDTEQLRDSIGSASVPTGWSVCPGRCRAQEIAGRRLILIDKTGYIEEVQTLADVCYLIRPNLSWLSPSEYVRRSEEEEWCVVDVRSDRERAVSVVPGALGREEFEAHIEEHRKKAVLVYCTAGCHSGAYVQKLRKQRIDAFNLWGGILAWVWDGRSLVTSAGEPIRRVYVRGIPWDVLPPGYEAAR
jgi:rhodanese-related sulfurtransferase